MAWFGQYLGTAYTGQWWGDSAPTPPTPDAGRALYTGGWVEWLLQPPRREAIADEVVGEKRRPTPEVQEILAEVAHEWLRGDHIDEEAAQRELELSLLLRAVQWRDEYLDLMRAYHAAMAAERARWIAAQERKRRQALVMLALLANL